VCLLVRCTRQEGEDERQGQVNDLVVCLSVVPVRMWGDRQLLRRQAEWPYELDSFALKGGCGRVKCEGGGRQQDQGVIFVWGRERQRNRRL